MTSSGLSPDEEDKCALPFLDLNGDLVFFDVQAAEPGTFTVPGVIDLEVYEPGSLVEISWIFFKGDPQAGPQPNHPFERPFNDSVKFSIDMVRGDDASTVVYEVMPPTNSSLFWKGGAPFGRPGHYSMYIPRLDSSCEYYFIGEMIYRWTVPKDIEEDSVYRLKLTTDVPPTTHFSGKLQISQAGAATSSSTRTVYQAQTIELSVNQVAGMVSVVILSLLLTTWAVLRLRRRSGRVVLE